MKYINNLSKEGFVNQFADFIVKNIDSKHKSRFQEIDFKSFLVIYGATSSDVVLDLNKIRDSFIEKNQKLVGYLNLKHINIIDLIDYREPLTQSEYFFTYHKSSRPIFHQTLIDELNKKTTYNKEFLNNINYTDKIELEFYSPFLSDKLNIVNSTNFMAVTSSFPYGFSLSLGRREFYYGEYICNQIFDILKTDKILFKYSSNINQDEDLNIELNCDSMFSFEKIKSLVLDVFDFNLDKFTNDYLKDYDIELDIKNQLGDKPWLVKDRTKDLILF